MKRLYLLRHAEARPASRGSSDFARTLTDRGRKTAALVAYYLRDQDYRPDMVLCSNTKRAEETWAVIAPALQPYEDSVETLIESLEVQYLKSLYLATPETMIMLMRTLPETTNSLLIVGHNPGIQSLAITLAGSGEAVADAPLYRDFPPTALAVLNLEITTWAALEEGCGRLLEVAIPDQS